MDEVTATNPIPGFTSETADVDGVRLHYWLGGDPSGQPVLLWHGFVGTGYTWRKVMPGLVDAGMAVLVPDMRGYGDSDKPVDTEGHDARMRAGLRVNGSTTEKTVDTEGYAARALAEEFRALVRQIGFGGGRPIIIAAHDMGAPPALLWAADHPEEVAGLLYLEEPVLLAEVLEQIIVYTPEAAGTGSLWWWLLALAPGVPESLIVGNERRFLSWFYDIGTVRRDAIEPEAVDEYLRTFSGLEGVLGALGVYRAAFTTIEQTEPLTSNKVTVPIVAVGGAKGLGGGVGEMLGMVAENVHAEVLDSGHFIPEECPDEVVRRIEAMAAGDYGR